MTPRVAVLTGDLIGSTEAGADALAAAMAEIAAGAAQISLWQSPAADTRFTRFRGDGWQILLMNPWLALRASVVLQARLRARQLPATRISIGLGAMSREGSADLSDAGGPAFERSGRGLDAMGRARRLAISLDKNAPLHSIIAGQIDWRMTRWSPEQAEAAALYLADSRATLEKIGQHLGISAQAVGYRLAGIGATQLRQDLQIWEDDIKLMPGAP